MSKPLNKLYLPVSQQESTNFIQLTKCKQLSANKAIQDRRHSAEEKDLVIRRICTTLPVILPEPETIITVTRPRAEHGTLPPGTEHYGRSLLDAPLIWLPAPATSREGSLILAGTHGDENSPVVTLSCALRTLTPSLRRHHVMLYTNPDGCQLGLRVNANGVGLNRNFPAANWREGETVHRWNSAAGERDVVLSTGDRPGSEPETQALRQLIHRIQPARMVLFHDPLACIEDPRHSELDERPAQASELLLVTSVSCEAPGSFDSRCTDLNLYCIAVEFPSISSDKANEKYLSMMANLLR